MVKKNPHAVALCRLGYAQAYAYFTISANGALAYRSRVGGEETQLTWFDRAAKPPGALGARARYTTLSFSRDALISWRFSSHTRVRAVA